METELEGMLVESWVHRDRATLLLRVEALERELTLVASRRQLEREAFETQRKHLRRRMVQSEEEWGGLIKELSSRSKGEEKLRIICQRRVQELEIEVVLLTEQLKVSEAKFRETHKALRRQRSTGGSTPFGDRTEKSGSTALPPDKARSDVRERDGPARGPSFDISDDATKCKREIRCWPEYERTRACDFVPKKKMEESGELKTVERVVAVLLEENIRLGSTERKLQETKSEGVAIPGMDQRGERRSPHRKQTDNWRKSEATEASSSSPGMTRHEDSPTRCPDTDKNNAAPPSGAKKGSCESRKDQHSQTDIAGAREGTQKITRGTMTDDDAIDIQKALAKITALTGMVQAQEEIEVLLGQELSEATKQAEDHERSLQLLVWWKRVLDAQGYGSEEDIRTAGLAHLLRRLTTTTPQTRRAFKSRESKRLLDEVKLSSRTA